MVWVAIAVAVVGVFLTWTSDAPLTLNGTQGPNNGWLVVFVAVFALVWARSMLRGSWFGVVGVLGSAAVMAWTVIENWLDNRDVLDARASYGLLLVLAAAAALGTAAVVTGAGLARNVRVARRSA